MVHFEAQNIFWQYLSGFTCLTKKIRLRLTELVCEIATLPHNVVVVFAISNENDEKHQNSSELPNMIHFEVQNCFQQYMTHVTFV